MTIILTAKPCDDADDTIREQERVEESVLIERAKTEPEALAELYRNLEPRISAYVLRRVGNQHEAEDLVANVFLSMVRGLRKYRIGKSPFVAWLYRIATNEVNFWLRKRRIRSFFGLYKEISTAVEHDDESEHLRVALSRLPLIYQDVLSLHYLEQIPVNEVAAILVIAPGTVKSRLARGRELLRPILEQEKKHVK